MKKETLQEFEAFLRKEIPELKVSYKNRSLVHKVIGFLLGPVNPGYMTDFVTTLGTNVAFPSEKDYLSRPQRSFNVLAHEFVHACDHKKNSVWFTLSYLFPQIFGLIPFIIFGVLAGTGGFLLGLPFLAYLICCTLVKISRVAAIVVLTLSVVGSLIFTWFLLGWMSLWLVGGLLLMAPWPSPGRTHWEQRGYAMSLALYQWQGYSISDHLKTYMEDHFVTAQYYFMCWSRKSIRNYIDRTLNEARFGRLQSNEPWNTVYNFLHSHRLVK